MLFFIDAYPYQTLAVLAALFLTVLLVFLVLVRRDSEKSDAAPWNDEPMTPDPSGLTKTCMLYDKKKGRYRFRRKITNEALRQAYF